MVADPTVPADDSLREGHVTVALSAYNAERTIERAIASILNQSYRELTLYVVNDASTDRTSDVVRAMIDSLGDSRLHLVNHQINRGTYAAKNLVLAKFANSEFYAHQDADDFSHPSRFATQVEFLRSQPGCAACGTAIDEFYLDPDFAPKFSVGTPPFFSSDDNYYHRHNIYPANVTAEEVLSKQPVTELKLAMNGSMMFRTSCVRSIGGFDGRTMLGADTDMLMRLAIAHTVCNLPQILYSRYFHDASLTGASRTGFDSEVRKTYAAKLEQWRDAVRDAHKRNDARQLDKLLQRDCHFALETSYP
jgi:glycosyltransferase involved in cell wall biosynthesis